MAFGLRIWLAGGVVKAVSQPAAPESSEDTKTDMPSPAACVKGYPRTGRRSVRLVLRIPRS